MGFMGTPTNSAWKNLVPKWTFTEFMYHSELIYRVLNNKLTPELNKYVDLARSELEYAWDIDLPKPKGRFSHL